MTAVAPLDDGAMKRHLARRGGASSGLDFSAVARSAALLPQIPRRRRSAWPRLALGGATAAAAIVGIAVLAGTPGRVGQSPTAGSSVSVVAAPPSDGVTSMSTTPSAIPPAPITPWAAVQWSKGGPDSFQFGANTFVTDAIADGDGFIAVGYTAFEAGDIGHIWRSDDGRTWRLVPGTALDGTANPRIVQVGDHLVVLAERRTMTARLSVGMWTSDDGEAWREGPGLPSRFDGDLRSIAGGPQGILVPALGKTLFLGPDVRGWTPLSSTVAATGVIRGGALAAGDGVWLLSGATGSTAAGSPPTVGAIWTSGDGETWEPAQVEKPGGSIGEIHRVGGGYVAMGSREGLHCDGCLGALPDAARLAWFSTDGRTWTRLDGAGENAGDPLWGQALVGDGRRVIAVPGLFVRVLGGTGQTALPDLAESLDGRTWTAVPQTGSSAPDVSLWAVGARGILVFGSVDSGIREPIVPLPWFGTAAASP